MKSFKPFRCSSRSLPGLRGPRTGPVPTHYYNFDAGSGTVAADTGSVGGANATLSAATWSTNTPFAYSGNNSLTTTTTAVQASGLHAGPAEHDLGVGPTGVVPPRRPSTCWIRPTTPRAR